MPLATSHHLSQCWPRSISPYGIIGLQWVDLNNVDLFGKQTWMKLTVVPNLSFIKCVQPNVCHFAPAPTCSLNPLFYLDLIVHLSILFQFGLVTLYGRCARAQRQFLWQFNDWKNWQDWCRLTRIPGNMVAELCSSGVNPWRWEFELTHLPWTTLSNAFSWMKMFEFR